MRSPVLLIIWTCLSITSFSQKVSNRNNSIKLTAGRLIFGTGDIFGYGVNVEFAKHLKQVKGFGRHIALGAELSFENGSFQPTVINPTVQEFFFQNTFISTTNIAFTPKLTYYPFNKTFAKGINITGGLSIAYSSSAREFQATRIYDSIGQRSIRRSYLEFKNNTTIGYRITAGYEWAFYRILVGARVDFDSYNNGDINTFYGLKAGYRF